LFSRSRLQRFSSETVSSDEIAFKKAERAKRFGLPVSQPLTSPNGTNLDVLKKRAERFGAVSGFDSL